MRSKDVVEIHLCKLCVIDIRLSLGWQLVNLLQVLNRTNTLILNSTSVLLRVQFFRVGQPTSSLAVWACVVPPSVMQHAVLLGRDSWMRFNT